LVEPCDYLSEQGLYSRQFKQEGTAFGYQLVKIDEPPLGSRRPIGNGDGDRVGPDLNFKAAEPVPRAAPGSSRFSSYHVSGISAHETDWLS